MDRPAHAPSTVVGAAAIAIAASSLFVAGEPVGAEFAIPLLVGSTFAKREGLGALVGWIVAGVIVGAAVGVAAHSVLDLPLARYGAAGMGAALGGGLGGLVNFVSVGEHEGEPEPGVTVDMGRDGDPEPRPADLFEDHPDPVLYVADEGGGPVVRAANDTFGETFDMPTTTLTGAPLADALRTGDAGDLADALAAGDTVDRELDLETAEDTAPFRVRSVGDPADGYVLFTPLEGQ
jgi:hypothetical protein